MGEINQGYSHPRECCSRNTCPIEHQEKPLLSIQVCVLNVCPGVSPGTNRIGSCAFGNTVRTPVLRGFRCLKQSELVLCSGFVTAWLSSQSRGAQKSLGYCPVVYRATRSGCIHSVVYSASHPGWASASWELGI